MPPKAISLSFLFLTTLLAIPSSAQQCYTLNGIELNDTYAPCNTTAKHNACCAINASGSSAELCLDSGLCMPTQGSYVGTVWQVGCTDRTGRDEACPRVCPDITTNFNNLAPVPAWNILTCGDGSYCCRSPQDSTNCCANAAAPKFRADGLGAVQFPLPAAARTISSFSSSASPSSTTTTSSKPSSTNDVHATAHSTGQPFSSHPTTPPPAAAPSTCPNRQPALVGGAVGGVLGSLIVGLAGLVAWLARREKRQRRLKEHYEEQFGQNFAYRRTVVIESAPGTAWGEKDEGEVEDGERTLRGSTRDGGRVRGGEGDEGGVGISG